MADKSFVTLERKVCIVCCEEYTTDAILIDQRLRNRFDTHTVTGWGMCKTHKKMREDGYVALVVIDPDSTKAAGGALIEPNSVKRTGALAFLKRDVWDRVMTIPVPENDVAFVHPEIIEHLRQLQQESDPTPEVNDGKDK